MNEIILNGVSKHDQVDMCVYIFLKIQIEFDLFTCRVFIYSLESFLLFQNVHTSHPHTLLL